MSEVQTKPSLRSPRAIIAELFTSIGKELSISGGWGQDKENACIIEKEASVSIALSEWDDTIIQKIFVEKRIYLELIVMAVADRFIAAGLLRRTPKYLHNVRHAEALCFR